MIGPCPMDYHSHQHSTTGQPTFTPWNNGNKWKTPAHSSCLLPVPVILKGTQATSVLVIMAAIGPPPTTTRQVVFICCSIGLIPDAIGGIHASLDYLFVLFNKHIPFPTPLSVLATILHSTTTHTHHPEPIMTLFPISMVVTASQY